LIIHILDHPTEPKTIPVCRYVLALASSYFNDRLTSDLENRVIRVTFKNEKECQYFLEIIRCIYKQPLQISAAEDLVNLIIMADYYKCILVMKLAMKKLVKLALNIDSARLYLDRLTQQGLAYKLPDKLYQSAIELLVTTFKDIRGVFTGYIDSKKKKR